MIHITTREEYDLIVGRGYQPLIDWRMFQMDVRLRLLIQSELFGTGSFTQQNQKFYKWCWDHSIYVCQETGKPLYDYSAVYISHIISKGADRRMAIDPRNVNILAYRSHNTWEYGNRKGMNIWRMNQHIIQLLKQDYNMAP